MTLPRSTRLTSRPCGICGSLLAATPLPDGEELRWCESGCDFEPTVSLGELQAIKLPSATEKLMGSVLASLGKAMFAAWQANDARTLRRALFEAEDTKLLLSQPYTDELDVVIAGYRQRLGRIQQDGL